MREMSDNQFDQKAWLERIGYTGPLAPTLETLNQLIFAHLHSIPYETRASAQARRGYAPAEDDRQQARRVLL